MKTKMPLTLRRYLMSPRAHFSGSGRTRMPVAKLLQMDAGTIVELDRQVGEAIDIYVNDRLVARGEIVLVENKLGITMTEIIKAS